MGVLGRLCRGVFNAAAFHIQTSSSTSAAAVQARLLPAAHSKFFSSKSGPPDDTRHPRQGPKEAVPGPLGTLTGATEDIFGYVEPHRFTLSKKKHRKKTGGFGPNAFQDKPIQKWEEYDGFGTYQYRHHKFPNNKTFNDFQKRIIFKRFAEDRLRINAIRKADILPKEIRRLADIEVQRKIPRNSAITRLNRRCTISGRARGIFHQFRVSRMVWRREADYNKVSGAKRAHWEYGIEIKP